MNKAYKVVYNESTGTYVAVSEIETSQGKSVQSQVSCVPQAEAKRPIRKIHAFSKLTLTLLGVFTSLAMPFAHASYAAGGGTFTLGSGGQTGSVAIGATGSGGTGAAATVGQSSYSVAIGNNVTVGGGPTDTNGVAVGSNTQAYAYGVAIGSGAISDQGGSAATTGTVAIGPSAHVNNADGGIAIGVFTKTGSYSHYATVMGANAAGTATYTTVLGAFASANNTSATAIGANSIAAGACSIAIGKKSTALGEGALAWGTNSIAGQANAIAIGVNANATGVNAISIGNGNKVTGRNSGAIGDPTVVTGDYAYSIGNNNNIAQSNTFAMGNNITSTQANSVILGKGSTDRVATTEMGATINGVAYSFAGQGSAANGVVSVGSGTNTRQVINVAAGNVSRLSTDAINGSQLYAAYEAIGAASNSGLNFTGNAGSTVHRNLGQTLSIIGANTTAAVTGLAYQAATAATGGAYSSKNVVTVTDGAGNVQIQFAEKPVFDTVTANTVAGTTVTAGSTTTGNAVTLNGNGITISNPSNTTGNVVIADGNVSFGGTTLTGIGAGVTAGDAVNLGQLKDAGASLTAAGLNFVGNDGSTVHRDLGQTLSIVGASTAVAGLTENTDAATAGDYSSKNVQTVHTANGIQVQFSERPEFDGIVAGNTFGNVVTIDNDGISISNPSNGQTINIADGGVNFGGNTLSGVGDGVTSGDAVNKGQLDTVNATASRGWDVSTEGGATTNVAPGATVDFSNTDGNIEIANNGTSLTFELADNLNVTSIKAGDTVTGNYSELGQAGLTIKQGNTPVITIADGNVDFGGNTLAGVSEGLIGAGSKEAVNGSQLYAVGNSTANALGGNSSFDSSTGTVTANLDVSGNSYNTVQDALDAVNTTASRGWDVSTEGGTTTNVAPGATVDFSNTDGNIEIANSGTSLTFELADNLNVSTIKAGDTVTGNYSELGQTGLTINQGNAPVITIADGNVNFGGNTLAGVSEGLIGAGSTEAVNGSQLYAVGNSTANALGGNSSFDSSTGTVTANLDVSGNSYNTVQDALDAVNTTASRGWDVSTEGGTTTNVAPGATVDFSNTDGNIEIANSGTSLTFELADNLNVSTIKAGDTVTGNYSELGQTGLTINQGNAPVITIADGNVNFGGNTLAGVSEGLIGAGSTEAVNGSQLYAVGNSTANALGGNSSFDSSTGTVTANLDVSGNSYNTVQDALDAVNTTASRGWDVSTEGGTTTNVAPGATVDFSNTDGNIEIANSGTSLTFELADNLNVSTIKAGDTVTGNYSELGQTGLTINQGNAPVITIADGNVNFGGNTLAGVSEGLIGAGSTEAVNGSQLYAVGNSTANALGGNSSFDSSTGTVTANLDVSGNSYNTVQDALDAVNTTASRGWDVSTEGGTTTNVAPGATVDFSNTDGNIEIANSGTSLTFELADNLNVSSIKAGDTVTGNYSELGQTGLTINQGNAPVITIADGNVNFGGNTLAGVSEGLIGAGSTEAVNGSQLYAVGNSTANALGGNSSFDSSTGTVTANLDVSGNSYNTVQDALDAVNTTASRGWDVSTEGGTTTNVAPGATVDFSNTDGNIEIANSGTSLTFELADNLNVSSIKAGDTVTGNYSELGQTGLTINQGNAPVITIADGNVNFGGNTLAGVSEGLIGAGSTEAVNGSQLYAVGNSTANALGGNSSFDSSTGTVTANLDVSGNSYNTVQDALDAVNTTASRGWDVSTEGGTTTNVAPGATVDFSNTDGNIEIANSGTSLTFELADNLNVSTIKAGDTVTGNYSELGQTGLTINQGNAPVITIADGNVNFGGNTLAGVSEGLIGAGSTEAVNGSQLYAVGNSTANALGGNSSFDSSTGTVTANLDVSGNSYNTVQDALDAVNTTASRGWDVSTEGGTTTNVAPGATVDFSNTDGNIEIKNSGTSLTFELADNISVNSMTAGDTAAGNYSVIGSGGTTVTDALGNQTTYGANGISIGDTAGSTFITINNGDVNFGDNTLTGVADGVTAGDAVNKGQLDDAGKSLTSAGLNFAGNAGSTVHKDLGQTMSIVGALTPAAGIAVDNAAAVAGTYSSRNVQTATDALGNLQIQIAENPFFNSVTAGDTAAGNFSVLGSGGTTVTDAAGNQTTYGANGISIGDTAGSTFITINNGNVNFGGNVIHGVGDGVTAGDAVNKGQLDDAGKSLTSAGLNFAGNAGSTVHKDLGQTMSIVGALTPAAGIAVDNAAAVAGTYSSRNVQTATDALGNLQIQIAENPFFNSVTAGDTAAGNFSVLGSGGTTVTDAAGNQTTYGANGISIGDTAGSTFITINNGNVNFGGNVIHGVGDGVTAGDAVNKGQLDDAGKSLTSAGLNFAGNAGSTVHKDLGQTMSIVGALTPAAGIAVDNAAAVAGTYSSRNVQTATDALGNLQIQIAENPFFNSVTAGDTASGNFSVLGSGGTTVTDAAGNKAVYGANTATLTDTAGNTNTTTAAGNTLVDAAGNTYNTTAAGSVLTDAAGNTTSLTAAGTHVEDALGNNATYGANAISLTDAAGNVYDTTAVGSILTNSNGDITNLSAAGTTVTDALGNQTTYGANGISIGDTAGSTFITINNGNVNFGGNVINGVGDGVTAGDAVNKGQLDGLGKAGLNFAGNAGNTVHKDLGATMSIVGKATANGAYDGQNVKTVTDAAGNLQIQIAENPFFNSVLAGETGTQNLSIMGSGGTTVTDAAGNKAVYGANAATLTDTAGNTNTTTAAGNTLVDAAGNTYNTTAAGSVLTDAAGNTTSLTAAGTHVEDALGNNATYGANAISLTDAAGNTYNTTAGGSTITNNNGDVTEVTAAGTQVTNKAGDSATYGAEGITIVNKGGNTIVINDGNVNFGGNTLSGVNAGTTGGDAVNLDQVTNMVNNAGNSATLAGLNFAGNAGSTVHKDLGQTLSIVGDATTAGTYSGQNVKTITDAAGNLKIQIAERPVFDTVTANAVSVGNTSSGNLISISDKGISIANNGGDTITISNTGGNVLDFGGVTLSGVNAGSISATSTDAVNGSQLFGMGNSVANSLGGSSYYDAGSNKVVTGLNVGGNTYTNVQSALDAVNQTASSGWNVSANGGSASNVAPGATVDFGNTDGNVQISNKGGNITVDLADNLKVDSIEVGGNKLDKNGLTVGDTTISSDGMVIAGGPSVTKDGIDAGGKVITNVADGVADSDAVNVGQLNKAINDSTTVINKNINDIKDDIGNMDDLFDTFDVSGQTTTDRKNLVDTINAINTTGVKYAHTNDGGDPTKIGTTNDSSAGGKNSSAFGVGAIVEAGADSSVAMGHNTFVSSKATNAVAIGSGSQALGESAIAMGHGSVASGKQSISIGTGNKVSGNSSGALGDPNTVSGNGSYAIGNNNTITQDNSFVLGNEVTIDSSASDMSKSNGATFMGSVALGNGSTVSKPVGTASTTIQGTEYKFAGSKPVGTVSVGSAGEERTVTNVAAGQISADSTDAINGSQLYATNKAIENIKTGGAGVVQYSDADSPTKSNGGKVTNNATLVGADVNAPVTLSNVADGKAPTDAVNVRQLQQMGASINNRIDSVEDNADAGTATAMAVAGLPQAYLPGKSMVSMSGGVYRGQTGYAVGYSTISEGGNWVIKAAASGNAQGYFGGTAGVGYQW